MQTFQYVPGKLTYRIVVTTKDEVGALADVVQRVAALGVNFTSECGANYPEFNLALIVLYGEESKKRPTPEAIKKAVLASPTVVEAKVESTTDGLLMEGDLFPLRFPSGRRAVIVGLDNWGGMLRRMRDEFGSGGETIAYEEGVAAGKADAKGLVKTIGLEGIMGNIPRIGELYTAHGWGRMVYTKVKVSPFRGVMRLEGSFECVENRSKTPYSRFMRGHFVGLVSEIFGIDVVCRETKCVAMGDPYCEFVSTLREP